MKKLFAENIKGLLFGLLLIIPPIFLYLFIKWDPLLHNGEGEEIPLSIYLLTIIYWVAIFFIYTYRKRSKNRAWQLAQFLSEKWTIEKREEERIKLTSNFLYMHTLKEENPEIFEDGLLKLP